MLVASATALQVPRLSARDASPYEKRLSRSIDTHVDAVRYAVEPRSQPQ
jgi:hypothetical protein